MTKVLVTGAAGFIGFHLSKRLLDCGDGVIGVDNLNDYYDVSLKEARLAQLVDRPGFRFVRMDIADREGIAELFDEIRPRRVVHLAAQAGVRYSLKNPHAYVSSNLVGFMNILEGCRHNQVEHLVYGNMQRDFTYIDDIVEGVVRVLGRVPQANPDWDAVSADPGTSGAPYRVYNIGNNKPVELLGFIEVLEECLDRKAEKNFLPLQPGDVPATCADLDDFVRDTGFHPDTPIEVGIARFLEWYRSYYRC